MPKSRSLKKDAEIAVIPGSPLVFRGARNVRTLSAAFIADLQEDWEKYGTQILELMRDKFPDLYFASIVKLARAVARGLLASEERAEPWAVIQGCYVSQLSDPALDRLVNDGPGCLRRPRRHAPVRRRRMWATSPHVIWITRRHNYVM